MKSYLRLVVVPSAVKAFPNREVGAICVRARNGVVLKRAAAFTSRSTSTAAAPAHSTVQRLPVRRSGPAQPQSLCGESLRSFHLRRPYSTTVRAAVMEDQLHVLESSTSTSSTATMGPLEQSIRHKLVTAFHPQHLDVINESYMHNVPKHSETHFKVIVVSSDFEGLSLIQRHRKVNDVLSDDLQRVGGIHALSIVAKTPQQWQIMVDSGKEVDPSPKCRGGDGSLPSRNP